MEINYMKKFQDDALDLNSSLNVSGRFSFQKEAMKNIVPDIVGKLQLKSSDTLLDIGCNCGDITIPLSFMCQKVVGVDGEGCVRRLNNRIIDIDNISTLIGDFREIEITEKFDCILMYSVLMYINSYKSILDMVLKAASLLKDNGRMLLGDIVNDDKKRRFAGSRIGHMIDQEYRENMKHLTEEDEVSHSGYAASSFRMNDELVMKLVQDVREEGYETYLLPQSNKLPFGYSREDILVCKW